MIVVLQGNICPVSDRPLLKAVFENAQCKQDLFISH
jgi:hypothetical protein